MKGSTSGNALIRTGRVCRRAALFLACGAAWAGIAIAQDPLSLKELLGRAQSQAEKQAVEELIGKLQSKPAPSQPAPSAAPAPGPTPAPAHPQETGIAPPSPPGEQSAIEPAQPSIKAPDRPAEGPAGAPPAPKAASAEAATPEAAVKSAEEQRLPSVDLEVFFAYKSASITPPAIAVLATLGRALSDPRLAQSAFLIAGHTDAKGGAAYNLRLSQKRADSVRRFLIANFRIEPRRLLAKGFGAARLKNPAQPLAGENRRVQIINISPGTPLPSPRLRGEGQGEGQPQSER